MDTEAEAKQRFSEEPIRSLRNGIRWEILEERALSLSDSDGVVSLLYCFAFVSDLPTVSVRLLTRMMEGAEARVLQKLDGEKIRMLAPLFPRLESEICQGLLQWIDPTLIAVLKPDLPKGEYDKWLRRWSDKELTAAEKDHDPATIAHVWSKSSDARSIIVDRANALVNDAPWESSALCPRLSSCRLVPRHGTAQPAACPRGGRNHVAFPRPGRGEDSVQLCVSPLAETPGTDCRET